MSTHLADIAECLFGLRERSAAAANGNGDGPFTGAALKADTPAAGALDAV